MATGSARARRDARGGPAGHGLGADGGGPGAGRGRQRADGASGGTRRAAGDGALRAPAGDGGRARRSPAAGGPAGAGGGPHSVVIGGRLPGAPRRTAARTAREGRSGGADRRRHDGARDGAEETACPEGGPRAARRGREAGDPPFPLLHLGLILHAACATPLAASGCYGRTRRKPMRRMYVLAIAVL